MSNQYNLGLYLTSTDSVRLHGTKLLTYEWSTTDGRNICRIPLICSMHDKILIFTPFDTNRLDTQAPTLQIFFQEYDSRSYSPFSEADTQLLKEGIRGEDRGGPGWEFLAGDGGRLQIENLGPEFLFTLQLTSASGQVWRSDPQMNVNPPDIPPGEDELPAEGYPTSPRGRR